MPRKLAPHRSPGEKIISLFARLLFTREKHSLGELARMLDCSKQTVIKNISEIQRSYGIDIEESLEGRRKYYRIRRPATPPKLNLTGEEMNLLFMCRAFTEHLLGRELFAESERAMEKSMSLLPDAGLASDRYFGNLKLGRIDYTPHAETIRSLIEAMNRKRICEISYKGAGSSEAKTIYISPLLIFSYNDALYLHGLLARKPGRKYVEPEFHPILAIHRIHKVNITDRGFTRPDDYDFEKHFNKRFGLIHDEPFTAEIEFSRHAADYAAERVWSPKQKIRRYQDGRLKLTFEAASPLEVIAKVLSFGDQARLLAPDWLVDEIRGKITRMAKKYG